MNIFVLHEIPRWAAGFHCDKHVAKMVLETAQLLSSALIYREGLYRPTHINHPCAVWTRESHENFMWLANLGTELSSEYTRRFKKVHKSFPVILNCVDVAINDGVLPKKDRTPFVQCMPDQYKVLGDPVQAYRNYYIGSKADIATWKYSPTPSWWPRTP